VFLKKTVFTSTQAAVVDTFRCIGCGQCVPRCPLCAIKIFHGVYAKIDATLCSGCGACIGACFSGALTLRDRN